MQRQTYFVVLVVLGDVRRVVPVGECRLEAEGHQGLVVPGEPPSRCRFLRVSQRQRIGFPSSRHYAADDNPADSRHRRACENMYFLPMQNVRATVSSINQDRTLTGTTNAD